MKAIMVAARQPLNVMVVVVALLSGLTVAWWLLPLGIVIYVLAVFLASRDSGLIASSQRSEIRSGVTSKTFEPVVDKIDHTQKQIRQSVNQSKGALSNLLQRVVSQTDHLVDQAHALAKKGQIIEQYLAQMNYQQLQQEINKVDMQIQQTSDNYTLQQLQETRKSLVNRQNDARDLTTYIGRVKAQLQNIDARLDEVLAETIRLRTADAVSASSSTNQVADLLNDLNADMSSFQQVLDTAIVQSGATTR